MKLSTAEKKILRAIDALEDVRAAGIHGDCIGHLLDQLNSLIHEIIGEQS